MNSQPPNEHDRQTIREIQQRCGVDPTGEMDTATILAVHETLGIAHKFFSRLFGPKGKSQASGKIFRAEKDVDSSLSQDNAPGVQNPDFIERAVFSN